MDNLRNVLKAEEELAERMDISIEDAKKMIKESSFSEYMELMEASVDKSTQHQTDQQDSFQSNISTPSDQSSQSDQQNSQSELKQGQRLKVPNKDGIETELTYLGNNSFKDSSGNTIKLDPNNKEDNKFIAAIKGVGNAVGDIGKSFSSGVRSGMREDADIKRMRELSGIKETTSSGAIASSPTIIGDTSDSHKPTVQLRKRLRLEKEKREKRERKLSKKKGNDGSSSD